MENGVAPATAGRAKRLDWQVGTEVVTYGRVVWAADLFAPYKSPGMDGVLVFYLVRIFHACLATGYVPATWCQVKVFFTPKPGRDSYGGPKDYRPISLTSFLLKTFGRL
jgi:hypothetical protein